LNYHSIHPENPYSTRPDEFQEQLAYLEGKFTVVGVQELLLRLASGRHDGDLLAITFDDGFEDNFLYALPILKQYNLPATFFLTTGYIDNEVDITAADIHYRELRPLSWEQVRGLVRAGMSLGSHTHTHPILAKVDEAHIEDELLKSKDRITEETGIVPQGFAYPLGMPSTYSRITRAKVISTGYNYACSAVWGSDNSEVDKYCLRRIRIDPGDSLADFSEKVAGNWDFVGLIQRFKVI
jgi:peptidoglycan/xylan/chitin deacetylase (PgdA/CDA1 family)